MNHPAQKADNPQAIRAAADLFPGHPSTICWKCRVIGGKRIAGDQADVCPTGPSRGGPTWRFGGRDRFMAGLLWALIVILAALWLFGFVVVHVAGPLIHLLLLIALVLLGWNLFFGSRTAA
jgi:hypothetical protein